MELRSAEWLKTILRIGIPIGRKIITAQLLVDLTLHVCWSHDGKGTFKNANSTLVIIITKVP